jgi:hypothetical protein
MGRLGIDFTSDQFETRNSPTDIAGLINGYYQNELSRDKVANNEFLITGHKDKIFDSKLNASLSFGGTHWQRRQYLIRGKSGTWVDPWLYRWEIMKIPNKLPTPTRIIAAKIATKKTLIRFTPS